MPTVFVYGTLTDPERAAAVAPDATLGADATLDGCHVERERLATLAPGGDCAGRLLAVPDLAPLDRYEGVDRGLYVRVSVPRAGGGRVETYVGDPRSPGLPSVEWPGEGPFAARVARYVRSESVVVRPAGPSPASTG